MGLLPPPPWARMLERCPLCYDRLPDDRADVCDRCGYQLRTPTVSVVGLGLVVASMGSFFASVFGGYLFPWPELPVALPFLESPTPDDLAAVTLWLGAVLMLVGIVAVSAGAYAARRKSERIAARRRATG